MRGRLLNLPATGRAAALAVVAGALVAAAIHFHRHEPATPIAAPAVGEAHDPLQAEMTRCARLGMAALSDAAWAANRKRFFTDVPTISTAPPAAAPASPAQDR